MRRVARADRLEAHERAQQAKPHGASAQAAPRALHIDLAALAPLRGEVLGSGASTWVELARLPEPFARAAGCGGPALGLALLAEALAWPVVQSSRAAIALAVADGVRRGLPTAARASVHGIGALHERYSEGHVGGDLALALASIADALVLTGRAVPSCAVLEIDALARPARVLLRAAPELAGKTPRETWEALQRGGPCEVLRVGPAAERGVRFASLAAGGAQASYVGRGGLGATFARLGLKALVLRGDPALSAASAGGSCDSSSSCNSSSSSNAESTLSRSTASSVAASRARDAATAAHELTRWLARSPRLLARSSGGTLELFHAFGARGELGELHTHGAAADDASGELGHALAREAERLATTRRGCRGCPTPCGWEFRTLAGGEQRAHFGAALALGPALGITSFAAQLDLLAACDDTGVDAREMGALLALECALDERAGAERGAVRLRGDAHALRERIERLARGGDADAPAARGALAFARAHGLESYLEHAQGQSARAERGYAAQLGQHTSAGGSDPLRSFPFLASADGARERLRELIAPLPLGPGADDPFDARDKGRLVWWHENLAAALDVSGFCAFSGGALLSDGACSLDELARAVAPASVLAGAPEAPARAWLAAGADLALLRRALDGRGADFDVLPPHLRDAALAPEYARCRGLERDGRVDARALDAVATLRLAEPWRALDDARPGTAASAARARERSARESNECASRACEPEQRDARERADLDACAQEAGEPGVDTRAPRANASNACEAIMRESSASATRVRETVARTAICGATNAQDPNARSSNVDDSNERASEACDSGAREDDTRESDAYRPGARAFGAREPAAGAQARAAAEAERASLPSSPREHGSARRDLGSLRCRAVGPLGAELDGVWRLALPCTLHAALEHAASSHPRAAALLFDGARSIRPAVFRRGTRLDGDELVDDGDTLDLVSVIGGG